MKQLVITGIVLGVLGIATIVVADFASGIIRDMILVCGGVLLGALAGVLAIIRAGEDNPAIITEIRKLGDKHKEDVR